MVEMCGESAHGMGASNTEVVYRFISPLFSEEKWRAAGAYVAVVLGYNHENCIGRAIASAFEQDFPCYEIFIMDDCSPDRTLDVMLETVKSADLAARPVRVSVTRNKVNQSACKQWYSVSQLSQGEWFGMFCGDDVSLPNRIKDVAEVVSRHPTALGIFTNFYRNGSKELYHTRFSDERVWNGGDEHPPLMWPYGCAAFWHRSVLQFPFEKHNIDDFIVMWRAFSLRAGQHLPSLVWAMDKVTVAYSNDTGVTNRLLAQGASTGKESCFKRHWEIARARFRKTQSKKEMLRIIKRFDDAHGSDGPLRRYLHLILVEADLYSGGIVRPLMAACRILCTSGKNGFAVYKSHAMWNLKHGFSPFYLRYSFGYISCIAVDSICEAVKGTKYR